MKQLFSIAVLIILLLALKDVHASHAAGGELTYEHVSGNTYRFTFKFFRDCTGISEPSSVPLCIQNLCTNSTLSTSNLSKISGYIPGTNKLNGAPTSTGCPGFQTKCQSSSSTVPGYREWWYQGNFTLPATGACDEWRFSTYIGARNSSTNITGGYFYVEAYLNRRPVAGGPAINNNSPSFTLAPIPYYCANQPTTYSNGTVEIDGDSLNFSSITPMNQSGCNFTTPSQCNYTSGSFNSTNNPFNTGNTFVVNPVNGSINFTPNMVQTPTISIRVDEYRNGVLVGYVMRDIQMVILNCNAPNPVFTIDTNSLSGGTLSPNGITVCAGAQLNFCFDITSASPAAILTVTDNHLTQALGSILNYTSLLTPSVSGCMSWTPTLADTGLHIITINATDSACAPPGILISQSFTLSIDVQQSSVLQASTTDPSCAGNDGIISATATGTQTFVLSPGNITSTSGVFNNLGAGNYIMSLQGAVCATSVPLTLSLPPNSVSWSSVSATDVTCANTSAGSITALATGGLGGLTYSIVPAVAPNNTTGSFSNLPVGTYTVTAQDTANCETDSTISITIPPNPTLSISSVGQPNCLSNSGQIITTGSTVTPPLSYTLNGSVTNQTGSFTALNPGSYTVVVTDQAGCTNSVSSVLHAPQIPTWNNVSKGDVSCSGAANGWINALAGSAASPMTYTLQPGNISSTTGSYTGLNGGVYTVIATDSNMCDTTVQLILNAPAVMVWDSVNTVDVDCYGNNTGQLFVSATGGNGGIVYAVQNTSLSNTTGLFTALNAASYTIVATDANGCTIATTLSIQEPNVLQVTSIDYTVPTCNPGNDGTITTSVLGGITPYSYNNGGGFQPNSTFTNVGYGNYTIIVVDANGCSLSASLGIPQNPNVYFDSISYDIPTCFGYDDGIMEVHANGGSGNLSYSVNNGPSTAATVYNKLTSGAYTIRVVDTLNCIADTTFILGTRDPVGVDQLGVYSVNCGGQDNGIILSKAKGGHGGYTYYIRPGIRFNQNGDFRQLEKGGYSLSIVDSAKCSFDTLVVISEPTPITSMVSKKDLACKGYGNEGEAEVFVNGGVPPLSIQWSTRPVQNTARATGLAFGWYYVNVTDAIGCQVIDSAYVNPGNCCTELFFPNAFTPNGDGRNDEFRVISTAGIELEQFEIYNRWGQRVWHTYTHNDSWNGIFGGERAAAGTYYYVYRYICSTDGKEYIRKGDIILVR